MSGFHHHSHHDRHNHSHHHEGDPELHAHKKGDAKHCHAKEVSNQNLLLIALVLTLGFSGVEGERAVWRRAGRPNGDLLDV